MNPGKNIELLNYQYDTDKIISENFQSEENIDTNVVIDFLRMSPKNVNELNFTIK